MAISQELMQIETWNWCQNVWFGKVTFIFNFNTLLSPRISLFLSYKQNALFQIRKYIKNFTGFEHPSDVIIFSWNLMWMFLVLFVTPWNTPRFNFQNFSKCEPPYYTSTLVTHSLHTSTVLTTPGRCYRKPLKLLIVFIVTYLLSIVIYFLDF